MTSTAHALVAGAIATRFPHPATALAVAFASHFILDSIPHWDFGTDWRRRSKTATGLLAITETALGITLTFAVYGGRVDTWLLGLVIAASLLPDWLETPWYIFFADQRTRGYTKKAGTAKKLFYALYAAQSRFHSRAQLPWGLVTQIMAVAVFLFALR